MPLDILWCAGCDKEKQIYYTTKRPKYCEDCAKRMKNLSCKEYQKRQKTKELDKLNVKVAKIKKDIIKEFSYLDSELKENEIILVLKLIAKWHLNLAKENLDINKQYFLRGL